MSPGQGPGGGPVFAAPLYVECHDLARWLLERTARWPPHRPLGPRLAEAACELVEAVALALTFPRRRAEHLERADAALVRLRCLLRLAGDLGDLSAGGRRYAGGRIDAAGRMLGGWRKRVDRGTTTQFAARGWTEGPGNGPQAAAGA